MPANTDNLSPARSAAIVAEEPTIFMTQLEVEAKLNKDKEKASSTWSTISCWSGY